MKLTVCCACLPIVGPAGNPTDAPTKPNDKSDKPLGNIKTPSASTTKPADNKVALKADNKAKVAQATTTAFGDDTDLSYHEYQPEYRPAYDSEYKSDYKRAYEPEYRSDYKPAYRQPEYYKSGDYKPAYEPEYKSGDNTAYRQPAYQPEYKQTGYGRDGYGECPFCP